MSHLNWNESNKEIQQVECIAVEKRPQPNKHFVYVLNVSWSDGTKHPIYRKYPDFFDLKSQLKEEFPEKEEMLPELSAAKHFDKPWLSVFRDSNNEKKKRSIEEFCQKILQLPAEISRSVLVLSFFEIWNSDFSQLPQRSIFHDRVATWQILPNKENQNNFDDAGYEDVDITNKYHKKRPSLDVSSRLYSHATDLESVSSAKGYQGLQEDNSSETDRSNLHRAACDYKATGPEYVSLVKGAILEVHDKSLAGWWFVTGEKGEVQGWAPGAFLEPLVESDSTIRCPAMAEEEGTYQAVADYKARNSDEVSYKTGDTVEVLETSTDGWWKVKCGGKIGFCVALNLERMPGPKKSSAGLFSRKSRRRKPMPPRKNSDGGKPPPVLPGSAPVYAEVCKNNKSKSKPPPLSRQPALTKDANNNGNKPAGITYTEVTFDHKESSSSRPVIKISKEDRVTYSDVSIPLAKQPGLSPSPVSSTSSSPNGPLSPIAQRLSPVPQISTPPRSPTRARTPEIENRKAYENYPLPNNILPYENIDIPVNSVISNENQGKNVVPEKPVKIPEKPGKIPEKPDLPKSKPNSKLTKSIHSSSSVEDDAFNSSNAPSETSIKIARLKLCSQAWFVRMMSRVEAEKKLMMGKNQDFLIRESTNRIGDFTLSVQFNGRARHFPIKLTKDDKYFIGKHNFTDMTRVVQYYQSHPLFYDEDKKPVSLGSPLNCDN